MRSSNRRFTPAPRGRLAGLLALCLVFNAAVAFAQEPAAAPDAPDPRAAQPERPTVATHAFTVAPGYLELETGLLRQRVDPLSTVLGWAALLKFGVSDRVQLDIAPGWQRSASGQDAQYGLTDFAIGLKWRLADRVPCVGAFAVQALLTLPTGSVEQQLGTGATALNLLAISSHRFGPVSLDINLGYARRSGDGTMAPKSATLWTISSGFPVIGSLGWVAELYGLPGTAGPSGAPAQVAFLTGPTFTASRSVVFDAGAIFNVTGFGDTAAYGGVTWNIGRLSRLGSRPSLTLPARSAR